MTLLRVPVLTSMDGRFSQPALPVSGHGTDSTPGNASRLASTRLSVVFSVLTTGGTSGQGRVCRGVRRCTS